MTNSAPQPPKKTSSRILALDYLRGFFVTVIIIDHLWKFPSVWMFFTGQAKLWVTAAEGFIMISGFLIGYIRGRKGLKLPFREVASKLLKRSVMLYAWMVIMSVIYVAIDWYVSAVPYIPSSPAKIGDWAEAVRLIVTIERPHMWIHFLALYAIFLALAIPVVWLFRKRASWLVIALSCAVYAYGLYADVEWMKWQLPFFGLSVIGFHFDSLRPWWHDRSRRAQAGLEGAVFVSAAATVLVSVLATFHPTILGNELSRTLNSYFIIEDFTPVRVLVAFIWFIAIAFLFNRYIRVISHLTGGVLDFIGTHSLSAYIIHGLVICLINYLVVTLSISENFIINSILGLAAVMLVYGLLKIPIVAKFIPR